MLARTVIIAAAILTTSACSSGAPKGTAERMAKCHSLPAREAYYCNQRLYDEVQALKKAEASEGRGSNR